MGTSRLGMNWVQDEWSNIKFRQKNYLVVLMSGKQLLCLLITQLLPKGGQQVAQLGRADETIPVLHFIINS